MTEPKTRLRLDGLEPDNLLAFLALLGLLRALEKARPDWLARAAWDIDNPPLRPFLQLSEKQSHDAVCEAAAEGMNQLAAGLDFDGLSKLKLGPEQARAVLDGAVQQASEDEGRNAQMWSALVSDSAIKRKAEAVERTPFCLLDVAQTSFLKNLRDVFSEEALPGRGDRRSHLLKAIEAALFATWRRNDQTPSFRWDPREDSRHAYRWAAPASDKGGVEHGANMLAATGLPLLVVAPHQRGGEVRLRVPGGDVSGNFSFAWPIWREPASLRAIGSLLLHPALRDPGALAYLGVDQVRVSQRITPTGSKYTNFTPAIVLA